MPTIPSVSGPQVQTRALGAPQVQMVGSNQADANAYLGDTIGRVASGLAQQEMQRADQAAVFDAEAQLSQHKLNLMFDQNSGVYGRKGKDALDVTNQTLPQFDKQADQIGQGLQSPRQKEQFQRIVQNQRGQLSQELNRYEFTQRNQYYDDVDQANVMTSLDGAVKYADDPSQIAYYQSKGNFVIGQQGERKGMPPEAIQLEQQKFNSQVGVGVIQKLATKDPLAAQQYYAQNFAGMSAEAQLQMQKFLGTSVRQQMGQQIAQSAWQTGTPGDSSLPGLIIQAESGGDASAVSPKGAQGLMQLMPDTAKDVAKEIGVPYDEARLRSDPNYNMALGTAYINKMIGQFGGNKTLAVAAYNAGPGAVSDWVSGTNKSGKNDSGLKLGDPGKGEISEADFIARIPFKETREYTASIMGRYAQSSDPKAITAMTTNQRYAASLKAANAIPDPQLRKFTEDHIEDLKRQAVAQDNATFETAADYVNKSGFQSIPAQLLNTIPADDIIKLRRLDDYKNKAIEPKTDYTKLEGFLSMPTDELASKSLARDIQPFLSKSDFNTVREAWSKAKTGDQTYQQVAMAKEKTVQTAMASAGIAIGKSEDALKPANLAKQQQFRDALQGRIDSYKVHNDGREPSVSEVEDLSNQLLMKVKIQGAGTVFGDKSAVLWEVPPENLSKTFVDKGAIKLEQIPPSDRRQIINAIRAAGAAPTPEAIIANYLNRISKLDIQVK